MTSLNVKNAAGSMWTVTGPTQTWNKPQEQWSTRYPGTCAKVFERPQPSPFIRNPLHSKYDFPALTVVIMKMIFIINISFYFSFGYRADRVDSRRLSIRDRSKKINPDRQTTFDNRQSFIKSLHLHGVPCRYFVSARVEV